MAPKFEPYDLTWSSQTANSYILSNDAIGVGVGYQSPVLSNLINSAFQRVTGYQQYAQSNNDFYQPTMTYFKGAVVKVFMNVATPTASGSDIKTFECINDNGGVGIRNIAPLITNNTLELNGLTRLEFTGANYNALYWKEVTPTAKVIEGYDPEKAINLGNIQGTFNLNLDTSPNNTAGIFYMTLTANTNFGTFTCTKHGRTGMIIVQGANYLMQLFTNVYTSLVANNLQNENPKPQGSNNGALRVFLYYVCKPANGGTPVTILTKA